MNYAARLPRSHFCLALVLAAIPGLFSPAPTKAAEFPALPRVTTRAEVLPPSSLLIETISVFHERGLHTRVRCIGQCKRFRSRPPRETFPNATETRFVDVEWIVPKSRRIEVQVNREGGNGRFLVLDVLKPISERKLVVIRNGCLDSVGHHVSCPESAQDEGGGGSQNDGGRSEETARTYAETAGGEAHPWTDYKSGGGTPGQVIQGGETVQVSCRVRGLEVHDGNTWWYRLASNPWNNGYYVSADAFYNEARTTGPLAGTPFVDEGVPEC
ncbi:MAG TPA: hypothetical protein VH275_04700 [Solirubrobacterales bacterium]|jgi:hypothetical protein|nr:hypothetical protein [Solirubrobacterales bacterium]